MVISMIEEMVALLLHEKTDDYHKKTKCVSNIDSAEVLGGSLAIDINSHVSAIAFFTEQMSACDERLKAETKGIAELDTRVAEGTMIRQYAHAESVTVTASNASTSKVVEVGHQSPDQVLRASTAQGYTQGQTERARQDLRQHGW